MCVKDLYKTSFFDQGWVQNIINDYLSEKLLELIIFRKEKIKKKSLEYKIS